MKLSCARSLPEPAPQEKGRNRTGFTQPAVCFLTTKAGVGNPTPAGNFFCLVRFYGRLERAAQFWMACCAAFDNGPLLRNSLVNWTTADTNCPWFLELAARCAIMSLSVQPLPKTGFGTPVSHTPILIVAPTFSES